MRTFFLTITLFSTLLLSCKSQTQSGVKKIFNEQFKWSIEIPQGFESVPADQWAKLQNRGAEAIGNTYDTVIENRAKTIFAFKSDQSNYFESNYQPFDTISDGPYLESFRAVNDVLYGTFEAQIPTAKLDSISSQEKIDGLLFQTFKVTITIGNDLVMEALMFCRLFGNKEFSVNIMTTDKAKQKVLLDAWRNSKFN